MSQRRCRRSRNSLIAEILNEALDGANKTRILYRCNLNCRRFNRYINELLKTGLIECKIVFPDGTTLYKTTEKGQELLKVLQRADKFLTV